MYKIVITNGWSDLNAGDSAIIMSIIKRLEIQYGNNFEVSILSELHYKNPYFKDSIDKIKEVFPNINIKIVSSPFYKTYEKSIKSRVLEIVSLMSAFGKLLKSSKDKSYSKNVYYKAIAEADIIISKGGHFIYDRKGINSVVHLIKCLYPMMVSKKHNKNYFFLAQSFGPFFNEGVLSKFNQRLATFYLNNAQAVSVREEKSYEQMKRIKIDQSILSNTSDYAFLINDINYNAKNIPNIEEYMVITLRQHKYKAVDGESQYLNTIKAIGNYVYSKYNIKTLIVPHVKGPNDFENDIIITKKFESSLNENEKNNFSFEYKYLHAKELVELYSNATLLIGTRFHSVIFGLCQKVPSLAISYSGYKANIMKQFGMEKFMIDIEEVNNSSLDRLTDLVDELIMKREEYSGNIDEKLKTVRTNILEDPAFSKIVETLGERKNVSKNR